MNLIKHSSSVLIALALSGLAACSTSAPQAVQAAAAPTLSVRITPFQQAEVDEAASAYVAAYAKTVASSLQAGKYIESLAFLHANADACLSSRASRLLGKELTAEEKNALLASVISESQKQAYQGLARGYKLRANGLEVISCNYAGLKVASNSRF